MEQRVVYRSREMQRIEQVRGLPIEAILRDLYEIRGLTLDEVGGELGITKGAVSRWLERFGIPVRRTGPRAAQ